MRLVFRALVVVFVCGALPAGCRDEGGGGGSDGGGGATDMAMGNGGDGGVVPGASDRFLLTGTILTPDEVIEGQLLVEGTKITCVAAGTDCSIQVGAAGATQIDTHGISAPGM